VVAAAFKGQHCVQHTAMTTAYPSCPMACNRAGTRAMLMNIPAASPPPPVLAGGGILHMELDVPACCCCCGCCWPRGGTNRIRRSRRCATVITDARLVPSFRHSQTARSNQRIASKPPLTRIMFAYGTMGRPLSSPFCSDGRCRFRSPAFSLQHRTVL
jgi:hypothetical protein